MRRCLVVANQTLGGQHLQAVLRERVAEGPCSFHVLVPATPPPELLTATEGQSRAAATRRLAAAMDRFRSLGAEVTGEVGDHNPIYAMNDVLRHQVFDEIILSTLPPGTSKWLHQDLPHRAERMFNLPITHVIADREPVTA